MNKHDSTNGFNFNWQNSVNFILILLIVMWPAALPYLVGIYVVLIGYVIFRSLKAKDSRSVIINLIGIIICIGIVVYVLLSK